MPKKRVFLIVLDSLGAGEAPDAAAFGDVGAHTLRSLFDSGMLNIKNLISLGLANVSGLEFLGKTDAPIGSYGKLCELSSGKDTTIGHWEIAGIISNEPLPTFPGGFDEEIIAQIENEVGRKILCNKPYSGTAVINDYGDEHVKSGALIVYTSADSVFQIAAHEDIIPCEELYSICRTVRRLLTGKYGVGRVIARPFVGTSSNYVRTANRRDFSLDPPKKTLCDAIFEADLDSIAVGKISDIFAGRGFTKSIHTHSNDEGMDITLSLAKDDFCGLCFVNLVDFDSKYGHRRDCEGYTKALNEFDKRLGELIPLIGKDDTLIITADHGCDPNFTKSTDHTREYTPLLIYSPSKKSTDLGITDGFFTISKVICDIFDIEYPFDR